MLREVKDCYKKTNKGLDSSQNRDYHIMQLNKDNEVKQNGEMTPVNENQIPDINELISTKQAVPLPLLCLAIAKNSERREKQMDIDSSDDFKWMFRDPELPRENENSKII